MSCTEKRGEAKGKALWEGSNELVRACFNAIEITHAVTGRQWLRHVSHCSNS